MSQLNTSFVIGYHGCDRATGEAAVRGEIALLQSEKAYDWLGRGVYFWLSDPLRALEWANWKKSRNEYADPYVIGAAIDLRNCLDLRVRGDLELLRAAHSSFKTIQEAGGLPMPENKGVKGSGNKERQLRYLDCAVLNHLHTLADKGDFPPYDTVLGVFQEGEAVFEGSDISAKTHAQIAVCNLDCIIGVFNPRPFPSLPSDVTIPS